MKKIVSSLALFPIFAMAQEAPVSPEQPSLVGSFLPFLLMFVVMYIFFILPKQKENKKNIAGIAGSDQQKEIKMKYCPNCGVETKEMQYCSNCGTNLQAGNSQGYQSQPQPKSQVIAFILWLFLFGLHRFYAGKIGTGILMLLMWLFVIFGMTLNDKAEMATIFETGQKLSQTGDTIVTISAFVAIILGIWELIDLIRILTGSFFIEASNPKYADSSGTFKDMLTGKTPVITKNKTEDKAKPKDVRKADMIGTFLVLGLLLLFFIFFL